MSVRKQPLPGLLLRGVAAHVVLPGDVPEDGVALGDLDVSVLKTKVGGVNGKLFQGDAYNVVGKVGEVEAKGELVVDPAGLVEVGAGPTGQLAVLEVSS